MSLSCLLKIKKGDEIYLNGNDYPYIASEDCPILHKDHDIRLRVSGPYLVSLYVGKRWVHTFRKIVKKNPS